MKITCAILCYNYGRYLNASIESCIAQTDGDYELEIIVIDDGSTDDTPDVCQSFGEKIVIYRSDNEGFAASLTKAVSYATGDYICFLDADDIFEKNKIITLLPFIRQGYLFITHQQAYIDNNGTVISQNKGGGNTSTIIIKRVAALTLLPAENELFFHPLLDTGNGISLPDSLSRYRFHTNNMTNRDTPGSWYLYLSKMTHNLTTMLTSRKHDFFWTNPGKLSPIIRKYRSISHYEAMESFVQLDKRNEVFVSGLRMFCCALFSQGGITSWHLKVFFRCFIQMRTLSEYRTMRKDK